MKTLDLDCFAGISGDMTTLITSIMIMSMLITTITSIMTMCMLMNIITTIPLTTNIRMNPIMTISIAWRADMERSSRL